jgi:hypothetical protein
LYPVPWKPLGTVTVVVPVPSGVNVAVGLTVSVYVPGSKPVKL